MHAESLDKLRDVMDRNSSTLTLQGVFIMLKVLRTDMKLLMTCCSGMFLEEQGPYAKGY